MLYNTAQYPTILYSTAQILYSTVQYSTILYNTAQYCTELYGTVQYCKARKGALLQNQVWVHFYTVASVVGPLLSGEVNFPRKLTSPDNNGSTTEATV